MKKKRIAIVLPGGGARGAYEAGVLSWLFEKIYPQLREGFEFDIVSGTSVGAIHAAYIAATAQESGTVRAQSLVETWRGMSLAKVLDIGLIDVLSFPLRLMGWRAQQDASGRTTHPETIGGLVDVAPLERMVEDRIPWSNLRRNLDGGKPGVLCIACTEVDSGNVAVFLDGKLADTGPWRLDDHVQATTTAITSRHVRASAAIPFLFPAVRVGKRYYLDGGLRLNTPLSPALRLQADHVIVVALKAKPMARSGLAHTDPRVITQPAFLLGKVLNALLLDQLEVDLRRLGVVNALIEGAEEALGSACLDPINAAIRVKRGVEYRKVSHIVIRPSQDLGILAAEAYRRGQKRSRGVLAGFLARTALRGVPEDEADLFSYLFFDESFTCPLVDLGRKDTKAREQEILALLSD